MIWLDGVPASMLPLPDRGLDFGDGLFETLLLYRGRPLYPHLHLQRLQKGMALLGFTDCLAEARQRLEQAAAEVAGRGWPWCALRLTMTRGPGPRGYAAPTNSTPRIILSAAVLARDCSLMSSPARLGLASIRWALQPALAGIKHLNRLEQVLAATECQAAGNEEMVMLGQSGNLVSVTAANLFLVRDGQLLTPALADSGIAGTRRQLVIDSWARAIGLSVREADLSLQDLETADEVFYTNSLQGLRPVTSFGAMRWSQHGVCDALHQQYRSELL